MDEKKNKIEKIYSRRYIRIPKIKCFWAGSNVVVRNNINKKPIKIIKIASIICIAIVVANLMIKAIEPVMDKQCINMAKSIATKISNEQATIVMEKYSYEDLTQVTKDEQGNVKMISANIIAINKIISDIPILIQEELNKSENNKFYIKLGSFTGSKILAGRGPNVEIKMSAIGNIETDLRSEFQTTGINQTLHRIYLEIKCNVTILTPFDSIEEQIVNQVLLAEGVIVGNIPDTYYNFEGLQEENLLDTME